MLKKTRLYRYLQIIKMNVRHYCFLVGRKDNEELKKYKQIHKGKRCFIVATGPSLTVHDLNLLKNEYCIGVNSCVKAFTKTAWRPTYLCVSDERVWERVGADIEQVANEIDTVFIGKPQIDTKLKNAVGFWRDERPSTYLETEVFKKTNKYIKDYDIYIPKNMDKYFCDGPTVVLIAIQLAIYMGFSEIFLLGTDCNFSGPERYSSLTDYSAAIEIPDNVEQKLFGGYKALKRDIAKLELDTIIYNATRGGMLEVFERVNLEDIICCK